MFFVLTLKDGILCFKLTVYSSIFSKKEKSCGGQLFYDSARLRMDTISRW